MCTFQSSCNTYSSCFTDYDGAICGAEDSVLGRPGFTNDLIVYQSWVVCLDILFLEFILSLVFMLLFNNYTSLWIPYHSLYIMITCHATYPIVFTRMICRRQSNP